MKFLLAGKWWTFAYSKTLKRHWGYCDLNKRKIVVHHGMNDQKTLEYSLHELLHAVAPQFDEKVVKDSARDCARALHRLGWRRVETPEK